METLKVIVLIVIQVAVVIGTVIFEGPTNTSALAGIDVTLTCTIQSQTDGQLVLWKRINDLGEEKMITYNNVSLDTDLYVILGFYNLLIKSTTTESEGVYQCDTGEEKRTAGLTISIPMSNMSMYWGPVIPVSINTWTNITCVSLRSRPAADLRWFYGSAEITSKAHSFIKSTGPDGYGDSVSTIDVEVTSGEIPYRCVADLPGKENVRTELIFPPITASATVIGYSANFVVLLLLTVAIYNR